MNGQYLFTNCFKSRSDGQWQPSRTHHDPNPPITLESENRIEEIHTAFTQQFNYPTIVMV